MTHSLELIVTIEGQILVNVRAHPLTLSKSQFPICISALGAPTRTPCLGARALFISPSSIFKLLIDLGRTDAVPTGPSHRRAVALWFYH